MTLETPLKPMKMADPDDESRDPMSQLRQYRDLHRQRDALILQASQSGRSLVQIANASGLGPRQIQKILGRFRSGGS